MAPTQGMEAQGPHFCCDEHVFEAVPLAGPRSVIRCLRSEFAMPGTAGVDEARDANASLSHCSPQSTLEVEVLGQRLESASLAFGLSFNVRCEFLGCGFRLGCRSFLASHPGRGSKQIPPLAFTGLSSGNERTRSQQRRLARHRGRRSLRAVGNSTL